MCSKVVRSGIRWDTFSHYMAKTLINTPLWEYKQPFRHRALLVIVGMEKKTIFEGFDLDGISYYYFRGKYYADDMTIRQVISEKEYRDALMSKLIKGA